MDISSNFLTVRGKSIFQALKKHVSQIGIMDIDELELMMLANSFDLYFSNSEIIKERGVTATVGKNDYEAMRPEYMVMKNEYVNILKHSAKFGLNPGDRKKIFKGLGDEKKGSKLKFG